MREYDKRQIDLERIKRCPVVYASNSSRNRNPSLCSDTIKVKYGRRSDQVAGKSSASHISDLIKIAVIILSFAVGHNYAGNKSNKPIIISR